MLETDIQKFKLELALKLDNAENLELQWESKAYSDCIAMLDKVLEKNGLLK